MGLPDDCFELQCLRSFRDRYVASLPLGATIIGDYYATAPRIVAAIDATKGAYSTYRSLYETLVRAAVDMISDGDNAGAFRHVMQEWTRLRAAYLPDPLDPPNNALHLPSARRNVSSILRHGRWWNY